MVQGMNFRSLMAVLSPALVTSWRDVAVELCFVRRQFQTCGAFDETMNV
jgi:hypothetical protein